MNGSSWGALLPIEGNSKVTRPMLDMRKARRFYNNDLPEFALQIKQSASSSKPVEACSYSKNSIKLIDYISKVQNTITDVSGTSDAPAYPSLESLLEKQDMLTKEKVESFKGNAVDFNAVSSNLRQGIALLAASSGFSSSSSITLNVLADVASQYMNSLCKSLKAILDNEALTGNTGFYDCIDQLLHDLNIGNIHDLNKYFQKGVIEYHNNLKLRSEQVQNNLKCLQSNNMLSKEIKCENVSQSAWVPVSNTSGNGATFFQTSQWKPFVETESQGSLESQSIASSHHNLLLQDGSGSSMSSENYWTIKNEFAS